MPLIQLKHDMDSHSREIFVERKVGVNWCMVRIGHLMWHPERPPHIRSETNEPFDVTIEGFESILGQYKEIVKIRNV